MSQNLPLPRALEILGISREQWEREVGRGKAMASKLVQGLYKTRLMELSNIWGQSAASDQNPLKVSRLSLLNAAKGKCDRALDEAAQTADTDGAEAVPLDQLFTL